MEIEKVPVRGLTAKEYKDALKVDWQPKLEYAWDNGIGIGRYLRGFKEGKIMASHCEKCDRTMLPARAFCELCFRPVDGWVQVGDTGTVNTFSICNVNWDASRLKPGDPPHLPAVIEIDGASKGMGILHILGNVKPDDIRSGMKVRAVWKPEEEREGSITDIIFFEPVE